jgi:WD40 repeat protein/DNA-binding SARP family transcriptional activator
MAVSRLEFRILGPLSVRIDGERIAIGGPKQRALLALLLLSANRVVSRERLISELFVEQSVTSADHALRNHVSRLRKVLAPEGTDEPRLVARAPGYLLRVEPGELDLDRFEQLAAAGREAIAGGDAGAAAESLSTAERLWDGRPLADLELEPFARVEVERLEELRLAAVEARIDAELALGRQVALVAELEVLAAEHPYRERFRAQLMLALYRSGRQAEGLDVYRQTRELLDEELGLEPATGLQELQRAILVQDPALALRVGDDGEAAARELLRDVCPFKGLAPFEPADEEFFFGRERLVAELLGRLQETTLLAIVGASGSGKSSLLRAGLLPALDRGYVLVRPGDPLPPAGEAAVFAVDQFEEVFALGEDERRAFIGAIVDTAWDPDRRTVVLLALRADFFGHLAPHVELSDLVQSSYVLLGPLTSAELRRAIEGPAERTGLEVEPALVDRLVDDVAGEPGGLPLLSTALLDLWQAREGTTLTLAAYELSGGVRGAVGRHAEAAFRSLANDEQPAARRTLLRLVAGGGGEALTRRRVARVELDADEDEPTRRVLETLVERRLLVANGDTIELVHEALLEQWPRLRAWLDEDAQGRRLHLHLTQAAAGWEASGREPGELYRGARLAAALEWAEAAGAEAGLNRLERAFLQASRVAFARSTRRLRALLAVAVAMLVAALVAGALALVARSSADQQATAAIAQRLGAQALAQPRLDEALLLAREGVNLDDSLATRSNLLATLVRSPAAVAVARGDGNRIIDDTLSPDGRTLFARADTGKVTFYDTRTMRAVGAPFASPGGIGFCSVFARPLAGLAVSPNGKTIAVGDNGRQDGVFFLVDTRTHRRLATVATSGTGSVPDVVFSPDGRELITGEAIACNGKPPDEVVVSRNATTGASIRRSQQIPAARLIGFVDGGRALLVTSGETKSLLLDARTLKPVRTIPVAGSAALSPDGGSAAFGHDDGSVVLVDVRTGAQQTMAGRAGGHIRDVAFSRDGRVVATTSDDGSVAIWDIRTRSLRERFVGPAAAAAGPVFSPDGNTLYTGSSDGSVTAWDVRGDRRLGQPFRFAPNPASGQGLHEPAENVSSAVAVSADNSLFATSPAPGRVTVWRSRDAQPLAELSGQGGYVVSLAFSHDRKLLAATGDGPDTVIWNVATHKVVRVLRSPVRSGADAVAFSPDDTLVATAGASNSATEPALLRVYVLRTGRLAGNVRTKDTLQDLSFAADGKLLASAGLGGIIFVWDIRRHALVRTIHEKGGILTIRFSPDGKTIATGDLSGNVIFWDPASGRQVGRTLGGENGAVSSVAYVAEGRELVTTASDGQLRLWDLASGRLVGSPLPGSSVGGWGDAFPDGKHAISVFYDGTGVVWNLDPAAWKAAACRIVRRNLTPAEWHDFLPERRYRQVCP